MRRRRTLTALLAGLLLVPMSASAAAGEVAAPDPVVSVQQVGPSKTSGYQRLARAVRPAPAAPVGARTTRLAVASYSDRVLALTNLERTSRGLRPLAHSACADGFADSWASSLSRAGTLSHQPLRPVLTTCRASSAGENVAVGTVTPERLVAMWMSSPGHRANLLQPRFTHLGVGAVATAGDRVHGVQVFLGL